MFGVLGPVVAWDGSGAAVDLKGPRHRAVLARLLVARGRVVPVGRLVDDLWDEPPPGAVSALRTFVAALRRALEPNRPPRTPATVLVTEGPGYAVRAPTDADRFEQAIATGDLDRLDEALSWWRGPAYADVAEEPWAQAERARLEELRLGAVERRADVLLSLGRAADAVPDLDAHATEHPWREEAWRLLALALYLTDRQGDALAVLRRARGLLRDHLGVDPGPGLRRLETDILRQADAGAADRVWVEAAAAYERAVAPAARLETSVDLLRGLALTGGGGLAAAREQRYAAIAAAERAGDPELTARVIGGYDVPAIWTRADDPEQAARVVAAAERALAAGVHDAARARLLATIALESRGTRAPRGPEAAREAERIARRLGDPALLAFALNGVFMQSCHRAGLASTRDSIGTELIGLSTSHGLHAYKILGHLVRLQARSALGDFAGADTHAAAVDRLAARHERPLAVVFTTWYRALRLAATGAPLLAAEAAYRDAASTLDGAGMPGVERGLLPLALLCLRVGREEPAAADPDAEWGPYAPWALPWVLLARDRPAEAAAALRRVPEPPHDLLFEALWCLTGRAAIALGDRPLAARARAALAPAEGELAGAGSGMLTLGPVTHHLTALAAC
ncbi:BTAD domain-containing putative transcriptional regulator [Phytohabitans aurantiacus]|uniref:SARP family transcriptional regulator n=1 Tax=Phytohabitans aurantiacus TaxID=3016789 RepID=A0ABQ5QRX8_9ACTN|nr:BTAD domain-containing putative transcriptional regulator [Phytohabitans aurantiacus]GLH96631.1 SARP family transcriptional regulator [Phytohabitans aurantiacus]